MRAAFIPIWRAVGLCVEARLRRPGEMFWHFVPIFCVAVVTMAALVGFMQLMQNHSSIVPEVNRSQISAQVTRTIGKYIESLLLTTSATTIRHPLRGVDVHVAVAADASVVKTVVEELGGSVTQDPSAMLRLMKNEDQTWQVHAHDKALAYLARPLIQARLAQDQGAELMWDVRADTRHPSPISLDEHFKRSYRVLHVLIVAMVVQLPLVYLLLFSATTMNQQLTQEKRAGMLEPMILAAVPIPVYLFSQVLARSIEVTFFAGLLMAVFWFLYPPASWWLACGWLLGFFFLTLPLGMLGCMGAVFYQHPVARLVFQLCLGPVGLLILGMVLVFIRAISYLTSIDVPVGRAMPAAESMMLHMTHEHTMTWMVFTIGIGSVLTLVLGRLLHVRLQSHRSLLGNQE